MANVKFVLNRKGVEELLKSSEMQKELLERGKRVQETAGSDYVLDARVGKKRANVQITAKSIKAKKSNLKHNTLLKALNAARGN